MRQNSTSSDQLTNSNTTKASIQALEDKINHPSSRSNNEKLVEFCKERLIHLQNKNDKAKGKEIPSRNVSKYNDKSLDNPDKIISDQDYVYEIDMQSSQNTNTQETQIIQKSWKMNVSSIVVPNNINSNLSCNYVQSSGLRNTITKDTKNFET